MIKLFIKLALVGLLANATWRIGSAYATHYRFIDAVTATTQFRGQKTDEQIHAQIVDLASQYSIPVADDRITVKKQANSHTIVDASYAKPIEVVPGFTYGWPFTIHVDNFSYTGLK